MVLDEPTTHLDIESLHVPERLLLDFPGGFVIVSHDRRLLTNVAEEIYTVDGGSLKRL